MRISRHFGLNRVNPARYNGWPGYLSGCCADATDLAALFARAGYQSAAVYDDQATVHRLEEEISGLASLSRPGDFVALSYSGHGAQRDSAWSLGVVTESLCLYDGLLDDVWFRRALSKFAPGVKVVLILDSCHSGGMDRDAHVRARVAPLYVTRGMKRLALTPNPSPPGEGNRAEPKCDLMMLAAADADETAEDGPSNGAFTGSLLSTVIGQTQSWSGWWQAVIADMSRRHPRQHPQLIHISGAPWTAEPIFAP